MKANQALIIVMVIGAAVTVALILFTLRQRRHKVWRRVTDKDMAAAKAALGEKRRKEASGKAQHYKIDVGTKPLNPEVKANYGNHPLSTTAATTNHDHIRRPSVSPGWAWRPVELTPMDNPMSSRTHLTSPSPSSSTADNGSTPPIPRHSKPNPLLI
ncbi:hypothetical protein BCR41DRAFT_352125 [Lobosporangium transversale]|uniref:Uncharacterized protein n=1 Tax=Lobosporangium transversale TaxID=64571 RepID=A0A1Y2GPQ8_9FUNG|nr:hypothetical protein BCR41DRAFT_352125 [Lobosporangium transversale]ORZ18269.1 hypothetical protein BCR41DRAFT_352125 [Lobosporangium transversale]|eukprot:XP_021882064.1 hypothetical protein BCR41DRAFT_352125 [Lobosporangium transversale]